MVLVDPPDDVLVAVVATAGPAGRPTTGSGGMQQPEVLEDHCALRIERESGRDVEVVAGEDDEVEVRGDVHDPAAAGS